MIKKYQKNIQKYGTKKEFNIKPEYNDKYIKTKIYNNRVYTNFQHNKIPKDNEYCACLSAIILYFC